MTHTLIEEFKNVVGNNPVFSIRAPMAPLFMAVSWQQGGRALHLLWLIQGRDSIIAIDEREYVAIATDVLKAYISGEISLATLEAEYASLEYKTAELYERMMRINIETLSESELTAYALELKELFTLLQGTIYIEYVDYDQILSVVGPTYKEKLDAIWERATEGTFLSFEGRRLKKLLSLVASQAPHTLRQAKYIFTDYFSTKSEHEIRTALAEVTGRSLEKKRELAALEAATLLKKHEHATWRDTLDIESQKIVAYTQMVMRMRDERKDPIAQMQAMEAELAVAMLERARVNPHSAPYVLLYELTRGVSHLASIRTSIESRGEGTSYLVRPDFTYTIASCDFTRAAVEFDKLFGHKADGVESLKGQIACRGRVVGVVRVVLDPNDDKGFQKGDILVTSMTRPEFVPLMKLAGAVVTNEGGITCHAAIVSRELNIPCIIGTKIATQVLHDGDTVEVDAEKGTVTVLK